MSVEEIKKIARAMIELKKKIFARLDEIPPEHAILTSNTSSLSITEMAKATKRPERDFIMNGVLMSMFSNLFWAYHKGEWMKAS